MLNITTQDSVTISYYKAKKRQSERIVFFHAAANLKQNYVLSANCTAFVCPCTLCSWRNALQVNLLAYAITLAPLTTSPVVRTIWITYCNLNILFVTTIGNFFIMSCFSVYLLCFVMCFNCFLEEAKCDTYFENRWKVRYKRKKQSHLNSWFDTNLFW